MIYFNKLDRYIMWKFLGTFFFSLVLILSIAVIFDFSEKFDDFVQHNAPTKAIIFDYYLNFIPYFAVLFSSLFVFISVIFFTSKMAFNTEIIAILSSGTSFHRLMFPYFISALVIASISFYITNYTLPHANKRRQVFEELYYYDHKVNYDERNVHMQIEPGVYIYFENYNNQIDIGRNFSMERFEDGKLVSKLISDYVRWDSTIQKWSVRNYYIRNIEDNKETISTGIALDTAININPLQFKQRDNIIESMSTPELNQFIADKRLMGADNMELLLLEKYKRVSVPFSTFILTLIGVSLSSRKIRGGIGMHLGLGLLLSFTYILFMQFSSQFAIGGGLHPFIAVWIPNIIYASIALYLYYKAPK